MQTFGTPTKAIKEPAMS